MPKVRRLSLPISFPQLVFYLAPLLFMWIPIINPCKESTCAFIVLLTAAYWMTDCLPLGVTGMLPVFLFSITGIMTLKEITTSFFISTLWLFFGVFMLAIGVQTSQLHIRIALKLLLVIGTAPKRLLLGFMLTSFVLSMFIANIPVTVMLLPIAEGLLQKLKLNIASSRMNKTDKKIEYSKTEDEVKKDFQVLDLLQTKYSDENDTIIDEQHSRSLKLAKAFLELNKFVVDLLVCPLIFTCRPAVDFCPEASTIKDTAMVHILTSMKDNSTNTLNNAGDGTIEKRDNSEHVSKEDAKTENELDKMARAITLAIPYSSSIGGVCTLTGSVPNLVAVMLIQTAFPRSEQISFGTWFFYCTPGACLMMILTYVWILWMYFGFRKTNRKSFDEKKVNELLRQQYKELGPITWEQCWILFLFLTTTVLWFTRDPGFFKGWGSYFPKGYVTDGTVSLGAGLLMFLLPKNMPTFFTCRKKMKENENGKILEFKQFQDKFCWEVIFISGGGLTLAAGSQVSGLSDVIAKHIDSFSVLQPWTIVVILTIIASLLTECTSIFAINSLLIPVLGKLAVKNGIHPYYLCLSTFLSSKLAFMLPVSNPMNAIAYSTGYISVKDMLKTGWMLNIIGICIINLSINTYGRVYLGLNKFPEWAEPMNVTELTLL